MQDTAQVGTYVCLKDHGTQGGSYNERRFTQRQWVVQPCCVTMAADHVESTYSKTGVYVSSKSLVSFTLPLLFFIL